MTKFTNRLVHESSPYLLQHAHNPVDWYPWGNEAFNRAKKEDKLVLVSIGYSACHWCHVMEKRSFEDEATARLMNERFVCVKVDREERPDVDQVYMEAVQLMTGSGGWPLNCFTLPDGRPVFGGTYFPTNRWKEVLLSLSDFYKNNREKAHEYADELVHGMKRLSEMMPSGEAPLFSLEDAAKICETWKLRFDKEEGGPDRFPKFPLPNNYEFLLHYHYLTSDREIRDHVMRTLKKMAYGGIYDHIGGGFARYSTDKLWKVPHFEKMLYDNAQLVSLYSKAFQLTKDPLYRQVVFETLEFIEREMTSPEGSFYSALDADSEGEEGRFYVWKKTELETVLPLEDIPLFFEYFHINEHGYWEDDNYILLKREDDKTIAARNGLTPDELKQKMDRLKTLLRLEREKRVRPGLDDKQLTSWNALMLKGYADAYRVFGEEHFLQAAEKNAAFLSAKVKREDGGLWHSYKNGSATVNGFLEDYCFTIEAFTALYEVTFREEWIREAERLCEFAIEHFYHSGSGMFFFTSDLDEALIARKMEIHDNVIPASNSSMAKCVFLLGRFLNSERYHRMAVQMLGNVKNDMHRYGSGYSNWGILLLWLSAPFYEVAIAGKEAKEKRKELDLHYLPNKVIAGSDGLPLLKHRHVEGKTLIYVCENSTCQLPVETVEEATSQMTGIPKRS